jgi:Zinc-finger of C2H2 type
VSSNPATGTVTSLLPTSLPIPRLPPGEVRRRQIAVAERLLREDHRRRTRPAISRGRKKCRVCNLTCIQGRRHLAKLARVTDGVQKCDVCDLSFESKRQYESHIGGRRHRKAVLDQLRDEIRDREESAAESLGVAIANNTSAFRSRPLPH